MDEEGGQNRRSGRRESAEGRKEARRGQTDGREVHRTLSRPARTPTIRHATATAILANRRRRRRRGEPSRGEIALDLVQDASISELGVRIRGSGRTKRR